MQRRDVTPDQGRVRAESPMVDTYLDHRVDTERMHGIGGALVGQSTPHAPELIFTTEAGRLPPAMAAAPQIGLPFIYAEKCVREHRPGSRGRAMLARNPLPIRSHVRVASLSSGVITFAD